MGKTLVGIDLGESCVKLAVCADGELKSAVTAETPDNLVREGRIVSPEAASDFLKDVLKKERVRARGCAVVLPSSVAFTRTMTLPVMSHEHLLINLPFEFRDFITQDKDKYYYDYAVLDRIDDENGETVELELIAATTLKETIKTYSDICRRAGLKLLTAIPEELAYMNLLREYRSRAQITDENEEYGLLDLGHTATRLHIYKGLKLQATRVMEIGSRMIDTAIAEKLGVDEHIARAYKHANNNAELELPECMDIYSSIVLEITRAVNFYGFNSPGSDLREIYLCGGGARITPLVELLKSDLSLSFHSVTELFPPSAQDIPDAVLCQTAAGAAMQ